MKKNIYLSYFVQVLLAAANFGYSLIFLYLLGPAGFGEYSIFFNSIAFFVLLFGLNLSSVLPFFIVNKKVDPEKFLFSTAVYILASAVFVAMVLYSSDRIDLSRHIFPNGDNRTSWIVFFTIHFALLQFNQLLTSYLNAHRVFIPVSGINIAFHLLMIGYWLLVAFGIVRTNENVFDLIWKIFIAGNAGILASLAVLVWRSKRSATLSFLSRVEVKDILKFTLIVYVCNALQFLVYRMDLYFINAYHPAGDVGSYALALTLSQMIWILPTSVSTIIISYMNISEQEGSVRLGVKYGALTLYGSILVAAIFTAVLYFLLPVFYGAKADGIFKLTLLMFVGTIPFSICIILANMNSGIGFVRLNLYATISLFILTAVLDLLIIPAHGIYGAAVVKVCIYIVCLVIQIIFGGKNYSLPWRELFRFPKLREL